MAKKWILGWVMMVFICSTGQAQPDEDQLGAWYMYFWTTANKSTPWGFQGDVQWRSWNSASDLEQLMLRGGVTYKPTGSNVKFTLGYGSITTGVYGSSTESVHESRVYQEALVKNIVTLRFVLNHRFRYEQRWVENQDLRSRYRYGLFLNVPLTTKTMEDGTLYLALYNELFVNGQRKVSSTKTTELFDRNRLYGGLGYRLNTHLRFQLGIMEQTTDNWTKKQLQFSAHHRIGG